MSKLPKLKLKSALLGMTTVFTIFGVIMFEPKLAAVAKDATKSISCMDNS